MEKGHPKEPRYYLPTIGIYPGHQGKGFGDALIPLVLVCADAEGVSTYLESIKLENVPIYRRVGLEITKEFIVRPDAPTLYAMWRESKG